MDLYLQFGWGMMDHCRHLLEAWGGGTAILSPRDLDPSQLSRLATDLNDLPQSHVLIDPQFYLPRADHERLTSHSYWPDTYATSDFWSGQPLGDMIARLLELNDEASCSAVILPGLFASDVDDQWLACQTAIVSEARRQAPRTTLLATVALSAEAVRDDGCIHEVLEALEQWPADGVYLVAEHPRGDYLVDDPVWLANVVDLVAGARLRGKAAVVGYASHQLLIAALGSANAIASGTWLNVRSFPPEKFRTSYDDEIKRNTVWYYSPQTLSEYKVPFLDVAHRVGLLQGMRASEDVGGSYAEPLFSGPQPSAVGLTQPASFRHYLQCLHSQAVVARRASFSETVNAYEALLDQAEDLLQALHGQGVKGNVRDFGEHVDVNRAAIALIRASRGPLLERAWSSLA